MEYMALIYADEDRWDALSEEERADVYARYTAVAKEMPIAVAIGWEPSLGFTGGSPVPKGVCEYDVMGAIRGEPVDLVKCETVDLYVPATAEVVIEGYLQLDPKNWDMEGPFAETKEILGGVFLTDLPDLDEAIRLAALIPAAEETGAIEIRPVLQ